MTSPYRHVEDNPLDELLRQISELKRDVEDLRNFRNTTIVDPPTPWVELSLINGWVNRPGHSNASWRRLGHNIQLKGMLDGDNSTANAFSSLTHANAPPTPESDRFLSVPVRIGSGDNNVIGTALWVRGGNNTLHLYRPTGIQWVAINVIYSLT